MSIPSSFNNSETYLEAASKFLSTYSWIYRTSNTNCLLSIESMPLDLKDYFLSISNEKLNLVPLLQENLGDCPLSLISFRQELNILTPKQIEDVNNSNCKVTQKAKNQKGISAKKMLEIKNLSQHVNDHCAESQVLVDLGAGLGYLSQALFDLKPNYLILGLEADKSRVEKARQRRLSYLPPDAIKSVIYQQHFVNADSSPYINALTTELAKNNGFSEVVTISIIGLHACADLSINAMLLFLKMPKVRCLHIMPCCYHKLELRSHGNGVRDHITNFPLSKALHKSIQKTNQNLFLNRPFLRLACQQTSSHWDRDCTAEAHEEHGYRMYMRALAEAVLNTTEIVKPKKNISFTPKYPITMFKLRSGFQVFSKESSESIEWNSTHEAKFLEFSLKYPNTQGPRLAEALTCLQTAIQKLCENVVLLDRLCYLEEMAASQNIPIKAQYKILLDEKISPRCQVLVAEKCGLKFPGT
ncbi:hypothetical protein KR059_012446 [Drosophila kikkawai]|nr:methyltransferase-like protein 25 [Drosophila kikkawai]KAH8351249.1 hypothetical protein KR059_012446 [Drosophila kikkawai]